MDFKVGDFVRFKASIFRKNEWLELKNLFDKAYAQPSGSLSFEKLDYLP